MRSRVPVQQENGQTVAADAEPDLPSTDLQRLQREPPKRYLIDLHWILAS